MAAGSFKTLLGPNGAGKTTTLRVFSGLISPRSGQVMADGRDITKLKPAARAESGICLVPEGRGIFRSLTVRENLRLLEPPFRKNSRVAEAVAAFPILGDRMNQVAGLMSGGEQQMLAVARAFLSSPDVVLLDEVSMGLAPKIVDHIYEGLDRLRQAGVSLLLVEQYVNKALELADEVVLLSKGSVVFTGPASVVDQDALMKSYLQHEQG